MITGTWRFRTPAARNRYVPLIKLEPPPDDVEPGHRARLDLLDRPAAS